MNLAIFASGTGTNAANISRYFKDHPSIHVGLIVCNNKHAKVLDFAAAHDIPYIIIEKERFARGDAYLPNLRDMGIDFIVLAGFLWKIPAALIEAYPGRIINIHPALLPKYGGKGMYGSNVHQAVIEGKETESGITIHYVDEHYDNGDIIFQARCKIEPGDTPASLAEKIHRLEQEHFPGVIEEVLKKIK